MMPTFDDFDIYHAGVSGGKDSAALALWLRFESGLPINKMDITFCDTGNEDPFTYAFLDLLRAIIAPVPIRVITPERDFWEAATYHGRWPSTKVRFCTVELKVIPSREDVKQLLQAGKSVLVLNGVRRAEKHNSNNRGSAADWELDWEGWGTWLHRPIVDWSIEQVWDIHRRYIPMSAVVAIVQNDPTMADDAKALLIQKLTDRGIACNPLYAMGALRVGCFPCINSRKAEIRAMDKYRPERIDEIEYKELHGFTHTAQGISTFFRRNAVPIHLRSREVTTKAGEVVTVPTIRDVADWSKTSRGGKQYDMDFDMPPASACDIGGMCE